MGQNTEGWSTILVHMICSRLDGVTLRFWESSHNSKEVPAYRNLINFLKNHCAVLQSVGSSHSVSADLKKPKLSVSHSSTSIGRCCFCSEPFHPVFSCKRFMKLKISERYDAVRRNGLCMNCLSSGHFARNCSKGSCRQCGKKHHSLLHTEMHSASTKSSVPQTTKRPPSEHHQQTQHTQSEPPTHQKAPTTNHTEPSTSLPVVNTQSHSTNPQFATDYPNTLQHTTALPTQTKTSTRQVLLSTAIVRICDANGSSMLARALLDSCSQYCFISSEFCRRMKLKELPNYLPVKGIGNTGSVSKKAVSGTISPRFDSISEFVEVMRFNVLPKLTIPLPCERFETCQWNLQENIVLADPEFYHTSDIDMIIGAEYYLDLLQEGRFRLSENGPTFQNTVFGWVVSGRIPSSSISVPGTSTALCSMSDLQEQLTRFWDLESCHLASTYSVEESTCEELFKKTTTRDVDGRFIVNLPRKDHVIGQLGSSRAVAERRFLSLERRLSNNPQLKKQYCEFMREYVTMGHMEKIREEDFSGAAHYFLPHHAVLKPESTTTKLRVVFDASCKTSSGLSLNDGLMIGPVVQDDLISIHARFRLHRIGIVADVTKMYRMIKMCPRDQKLQLILWRNDTDEPIEVFQLTTVTYGTASAPFLATRCMVQLAEDGEATHPGAAKVLRKDFYVDDMITGVDNPEEGKRLVEDTIALTDSAGFTLRKWNSNCEEVLKELQPDRCDHRAEFEMDSSPPISTVKTLGLVWCIRTDNFRFTMPEWNTTSVVTKRVVISDASKLFDPLGLIGPVVAEAKIFIQTLWKLELNWDDPLPENLQAFWLNTDEP
ncbi:uncharacterized protein LOC134222495 [Armigeres subalbatus]|uniref:uncharacterized protein LOC134222495 n=1 Tax=Armigeres subalbatus TaxID=124917 RepID=UPI002ED0B00D